MESLSLINISWFTFTCIASDSVNTVAITTCSPWIVSEFFTFVRVLTAVTFDRIESVFANALVRSFSILALGSASANFWIFLTFIYIFTFIIVIWFISRGTFFFFWNTSVIRSCSYYFYGLNIKTEIQRSDKRVISGTQLLLTSLAPSSYWELSMIILKLNVKRTPQMWTISGEGTKYAFNESHHHGGDSTCLQ